jgi:hypothetical protein
MKQLVAIVMIAFLIPATATVALAKSPCKDDKEKFCKDAKASGKKVATCLKEHEAELSPACKESIEAKKAEKRAKKEAGQKSSGDKPAGDKPSEAKPAETKPAESAPSESAPSDSAAPGGGETKP